MIEFKKILHPTDFSDNSNEALEVAVGMAEKFGAGLFLLHVVESFDYSLPEYYMAEDELRSEIARRMEGSRAELEKMAAKITNVRTHMFVEDGKPFMEIIRVAKDQGADMIVLGTRGRTGLAHILIGSTAEKVVRTAPCPVLTVRSKGDVRDEAQRV